jgi:hypothetical protein
VTVSFAFSYTLWAASEMKVYLRSAAGVETLQTLTTHYSLSPSSYPATSGNVVFVTAPASGVTVVLIRTQALSQALDLVSGDPMPSDLIERRFDIMAGIIQNLSERIDRASLFPITSTLASIAMPELSTDVAGDYLTVNADGDGWTLASNLLSSTVTTTAFVDTLLDDANATTFLATLGLTVSTFAKTLLDDTTLAATMATLGFLAGSGTVDFGNVSDNVTATGSTITVTGAAAGDWVLNVTASGDILTTAGASLYGKVTSADTVTPYLHNDSTGSFNAASQTLYVLVLKKSSLGL